MPKTGRPKKEYNRKLFVDLIGLGCSAEEICWVFRDDDGKPANIDTISRWCKREFGMTFQEYRRQNGAMALKMTLRKNQLKLSETSAPMAIFLGKNYLGQSDNPAPTETATGQLAELIDGLREPYDLHEETAGIDGAVADEPPETD